MTIVNNITILIQQTLNRPIDKKDQWRLFGLVEPPVLAILQNPSEKVEAQPKTHSYIFQTIFKTIWIGTSIEIEATQNLARRSPRRENTMPLIFCSEFWNKSMLIPSSLEGGQPRKKFLPMLSGGKNDTKEFNFNKGIQCYRCLTEFLSIVTKFLPWMTKVWPMATNVQTKVWPKFKTLVTKFELRLTKV